MKIILNLSRYCIETASRKKHEQLMKEYFKTNSEDEKTFIENQISALKYFLEKADFSELRYHCSKLDTDKEVVLLVPYQLKAMHISFNEKRLYPKWKSG